ncbi:MAG: glycosyltransferase family 4 protein [Paludibacteraceae bacterium]
MSKKILFISQYFYPEEFRGNDIAFDWVERGYEVTVICAVPNYPKGKYFEGYGLFRNRKEVINGVNIIRIPVIPRGNASGIMLMLNYFSFAILGSIFSLFHSIWIKYDLVFVQQLSPVTMALPAVIIKRIQKIPLILWVLDLWPESLKSAGKINNKFIIGFFEILVKYIYRNSSTILISSKGFKSQICAKGVSSEKIKYFPNWAEDSFKKVNRDLKIPILPEGFIVMFAGNIGEAQDFESVLSAALKLKENKKIKFVLIGDGRKRKWVEDYCNENNLKETVYCLGRFPLDTMPLFFEKASVMMVSLKDEYIFNLTLPAKVQAYMISGKPLIGMMNGEGNKIINETGCGYCVNATDSDEFSKKILAMSKLRQEELQRMGQLGADYANFNFDKKILLNKLNELMRIELINR